MITTEQIRDAINQLLVDKLQAETVYINRCPKTLSVLAFGWKRFVGIRMTSTSAR
jgi:hypothetical protein